MRKWSECFVEKWQSTSVTEQLDAVQKNYYKWIVWCFVLIGAGMGGGLAMINNPDHKIATTGLFIGLFLAITGIVNFAVLRLWAHTRLAMLRIVWEMQKYESKNSKMGKQFQ